MCDHLHQIVRPARDAEGAERPRRAEARRQGRSAGSRQRRKAVTLFGESLDFLGNPPGTALAEIAGVLKSIWMLDATASTEVMKGPALRTRDRQIRWLRHAVQAVFAVLVVWIGVDFVAWVGAMERGDLAATRPPGVEAFLPISGLISLRYLFMTGSVHPVHPAALVLLAAIVGSSVLLKKSFCSWVCPVGTLSEALAKWSMAMFGRRLKLPRVVDVPLRGLKYLLLLFFVYAVFYAMNGEALQGFLESPYNQIADVKMLDFFARPSTLTVKVLFALVLLSLAIPYAWCRYLCPYGALLGFLSLLSPLKITRDGPSCIDCGLCTKACRRIFPWSGSPACHRTNARAACRAWRPAPSRARCAWKRPGRCRGRCGPRYSRRCSS